MLHKKVLRKIELNLNRSKFLNQDNVELLTEYTFSFGTIKVLSHLVSSISIPL